MKLFRKVILVVFVCALLFFLLHKGLEALWSYSNPVVGKSNYDGTITYKGETYYSVVSDGLSLSVFTKDKYLGMLDDSYEGDRVYSIKYDKKGYICVSYWDDTTVYSKIKEKFTKGNEITSIYLDYHDPNDYRRIADEKNCQTLLSLNNLTGENYTYIPSESGRFFVSIYGCYDNSAIATEQVGMIAFKDNKWIFASYEQNHKAVGSYTGIIINDIDIIKDLERIIGKYDLKKGYFSTPE